MENLRVWAADQELVIASYFFWNSGTDMQRSLEGLLRSLLYNIFQQCPTLMNSLHDLYTVASARLTAWSLSDLSNIFSRLKTLDISTKFCFFIDGLDEYDGFHPDVVDLIASLASSPNIKICLSSRPWNVFEDAYGEGAYPTLKLQDLTNSDMAVYVKDKLEEDRHFAKMKLADDGCEDLVAEIETKAQGVFLWVFLVVRSLLRGLTNYDTISDLRRRLALLPDDLDAYFKHMLDSTERVYHQQAAQMLQTCLASKSPPSLLAMSFYDEQDPEFGLNPHMKPWTQNDVGDVNRTTWKRVNARCVDLVEITFVPQVDHSKGLENKVEFLHRTMREFLETSEIQTILVERQGVGFDPEKYLCHAHLAQIKRQPRSSVTPWKKFLHYALRAEFKFNSPQTSILEEFDRVSHCHKKDLRRILPPELWVDFGHDNALCERLWFLATCIREGLVLYVKSQLEKSTSRFEPMHIDWLLAVAITTTWRRTSSSSKVQLQENQLIMLRLLMNHSADPNHNVMGQSTWEYLFSFANLEDDDSPKQYFLGQYLEVLLAKGITLATEQTIKWIIGNCLEADQPRLYDLCYIKEDQPSLKARSEEYRDCGLADSVPQSPTLQDKAYEISIRKRPLIRQSQEPALRTLLEH